MKSDKYGNPKRRDHFNAYTLIAFRGEHHSNSMSNIVLSYMEGSLFWCSIF